MKVTLDLDALLHEGKITPEDHAKFTAFSARETGSLAFSIMISLSVLAISVAALALVPNPRTAIVLGLVIALGSLVYMRSPKWDLVANICIVIGALMFGGGVLYLEKGSVNAFLAVAVTFGAAGIIARSWMLMMFSVLLLSAALGARTAYWHATYAVGVQEPALTIFAFSCLAIIAYQISLRLKTPYEGLALVVARTSVFLVNMGFWVGSLWGDRLIMFSGGVKNGQNFIPSKAFALAWALAILGAMVWAYLRNRRWLVNVAAVFVAIHFYTQWFSYFGANPGSLLFSGVTALALTLGFRHWNLQNSRVR